MHMLIEEEHVHNGARPLLYSGWPSLTVVDEIDAQWAVDKEGLRLLGRAAAGSGVPHMPNANTAYHTAPTAHQH